MIGWPRRRWVRWCLGAAGLVPVLAGLAFGGVAWGRPHLTWRLHPLDNHLVLALASGGGPFAGWLLSGGTVAVGAHHRPEVTLTLPAGRTSRMVVSVTSVWSTRVRLAVRVPPAPALAGTSVAGNAVTLRFSMPVTVANTPCGLSGPATPVTMVTFTRATSACSGTLHLVARSGEQASISILVPAIPPPPPPPPPAVPSSVPAPVISFGPPGGGAFYITIDDGRYPDPEVLSLMQQTHVPITAFLVSNAAAENLDYWKAFVAAGGDIEDHTVSHPDLTKLSESADEAQWAGAARAFTAWFGTAPTLGRPPYGVVNTNVRIAASQAGLRDVVLWSASMYNGQLTTYDGRPLRAGEIVILHWIPGLYNSLVQLLAIASAQGLHPAPLVNSLAQGGS